MVPHAPLVDKKRPLLWLAGGAALGIVLAAVGLLSSGEAVPEDAVALVNGTPIYAEDHARLVAGLESDTRRVATLAVRKRVLDRMIDEELLVQRGLELGLAKSDRRLRGDITQAMIRSVVVEVEDREPSDGELRDFYAEQSGFFTQPGRVQVEQVFFRVPAGAEEASVRARAELARERLLAGDSIAAVRKALGDPEVSPLPDVLLPPLKLREYIGPTALRRVMALQKGAVSEPVRSGTGIHVFLLVDREAARTPPLDEIRKQVRAEWVRRAGDRALRKYLDDLRERADVVVEADLQ